MKVKTLNNVTSAIKIEYTIFNNDGKYIEDFKIDYLGNREELDRNLDKYLRYKNCEVRNVSVRGEWLEISVTKK